MTHVFQQPPQLPSRLCKANVLIIHVYTLHTQSSRALDMRSDKRRLLTVHHVSAPHRHLEVAGCPVREATYPALLDLE